MDRSIFTNLAVALILILVQVLICNHIMLFNVAVAFVFIYVIVSMPMSMKVDWLLTIAFFMGLLVDMFSDTAGLNALACTVLAFVRRPVLYAYISKDDHTKAVTPTVRSLGFSVYAKYLFTLSLIYCALVFILEFFSYAAFREIAIMTGASSLFTFLTLLALDSLIVAKQ